STISVYTSVLSRVMVAAMLSAGVQPLSSTTPPKPTRPRAVAMGTCRKISAKATRNPMESASMSVRLLCEHGLPAPGAQRLRQEDHRAQAREQGHAPQHPGRGN